MRIIITLALLLTTPLSAFANIGFSPNPGDQSVRYLGAIFGNVGNALTGLASPLIAQIFHAFNCVVLVLCAILITYTLFIGVLYTANDGEILGRKWSKFGVPLRIALGIALMLPKLNGYSMLQVFIMWIVIQGVGAADLVWSTTLKGLMGGESVAPPYTNAGTGQQPSMDAIITQASAIAQAQVCVNIINQVYGAAGTNFSCGWYPATDSNGITYQQYSCGENPSANSLYSACGSATPNTSQIHSAATTLAAKYNQSGTNATNAIAQATYQNVEDATRAMIESIQPLVEYTTNVYNNPPTSVQQATAFYLEPSLLIQAANTYIQVFSSQESSSLNSLQRQAAINGLQQNNLDQTSCLVTPNNTFTMKECASANDKGWLEAGWYYLNIIQHSVNTISQQYQNWYPALLVTTIPNNNTLDSAGFTVNSSAYAPILAYAANETNLYNHSYTDSTEIPNWIAQALPSTETNGAQYLAQAVDSVIDDWGTLFQRNAGGEYSAGGMQEQKFTNPVLNLAQFGQAMLTQSSQAYVEIGTYFGTQSSGEWWKDLISSIWGSNQVKELIGAAWFLPLEMAILGMMMSSGLMLSYHIPLVPGILFTFGGIGWLMGVIEGMVAAPIVCFGLIHPGGQNEILSKAEPAVLLIINMFLRPTLLLIGLLIGIGLCFVSVSLLDNSFQAMVVGLQTSIGIATSGSSMPILSSVFLMTLYTAICVLLVQKTFAMIFIVPDKVLRWIQGGEATGQQFSDIGLQDEQKLSGQMNSVGTQFSQAAGQTVQGKAQSEIQKEQTTNATINSIRVLR